MPCPTTDRLPLTLPAIAARSNEIVPVGEKVCQLSPPLGKTLGLVNLLGVGLTSHDQGHAAQGSTLTSEGTGEDTSLFDGHHSLARLLAPETVNLVVLNLDALLRALSVRLPTLLVEDLTGAGVDTALCGHVHGVSTSSGNLLGVLSEPGTNVCGSGGSGERLLHFVPLLFGPVFRPEF